MIALLSPAKSLDFKSPVPVDQATTPRFADDALSLAAAAAKLSVPKLEKLMGISRKLAELNVARFRQFPEQEERQALFAFAGDVYVGFEARSLDTPAIDYAQQHVRLLSGLYGLLRPLDLIRAYRLEMGTRWAPGRATTLYAWWGHRVTEALDADLGQEGSNEVLNLASKEYWHVIGQAPPSGRRVVSIDFRENGPGGPRFNSFAAKRARGMMARWLCEHRIEKMDDMRGFDSDGYRFVAADSDANSWRFLRSDADAHQEG